MSKTTNPDKVQAHIEALYRRKKDLDSRIEVCYAERVNDSIVNNMKLQKVKLNDEIATFKKRLAQLLNQKGDT